ncbi:MAG: hypothetical protein JWO45_716 [Spartobacteria bacterium]|nr:hypothetical protein [Spartobacteria bacterium]
MPVSRPSTGRPQVNLRALIKLRFAFSRFAPAPNFWNTENANAVGGILD